MARFCHALGWGWAAFVWGYALVWFLVNDRVKLLAYRIFDPVKAVPKHEAKAEPQPEDNKGGPMSKAKAESPAPGAKAETGPGTEGEAEPKPEDNKEYPVPKAKAESAPGAKAETGPSAEAEAKPEAAGQPKSDAEAEAKPEFRAS